MSANMANEQQLPLRRYLKQEKTGRQSKNHPLKLWPFDQHQTQVHSSTMTRQQGCFCLETLCSSHPSAITILLLHFATPQAQNHIHHSSILPKPKYCIGPIPIHPYC